MRRAKLSDREDVVLALQDEIRRTDESRYDHRLHGVLLVAQGLSCRQVAKLFGDAPRTIAYWVRQFEEKGLIGLAEGERLGRPRTLSKEQLDEVDLALRKSPTDFGLISNLWDGKTLSQFVAHQWGVTLGVRQSQPPVQATWVSPQKASARNRPC
jgi:transposase